MTRLARHDEIVERMAKAMRQSFRSQMNLPPREDAAWQTYKKEATAALDALLTAVVELGVGVEAGELAASLRSAHRRGMEEAAGIADKVSAFAEYRACTNIAIDAKEAALNKMEAADEIRIAIRAAIKNLEPK